MSTERRESTDLPTDPSSSPHSFSRLCVANRDGSSPNFSIHHSSSISKVKL